MASESVDALLVQLMAQAEGQWAARIMQICKAVKLERAAASAGVPVGPAAASANHYAYQTEKAVFKSTISTMNDQLKGLKKTLQEQQQAHTAKNDQIKKLNKEIARLQKQKASTSMSAAPAFYRLTTTPNGLPPSTGHALELRRLSPPQGPLVDSGTSRMWRGAGGGESSTTAVSMTALPSSRKRGFSDDLNNDRVKKIKTEHLGDASPARIRPFRTSKPVCEGCLGSFGLPCDGNSQCSNCWGTSSRCVYVLCVRGLACDTPFCPCLHEDQWNPQQRPRWHTKDLSAAIAPDNFLAGSEDGEIMEERFDDHPVGRTDTYRAQGQASLQHAQKRHKRNGDRLPNQNYVPLAPRRRSVPTAPQATREPYVSYPAPMSRPTHSTFSSKGPHLAEVSLALQQQQQEQQLYHSGRAHLSFKPSSRFVEVVMSEDEA